MSDDTQTAPAQPAKRAILTLANPPKRPILTLTYPPRAQPAPNARRAPPAKAKKPQPQPKLRKKLTPLQQRRRQTLEQRLAEKARSEATNNLLVELRATYPGAFGGDPVPLAIGIKETLIEFTKGRYSRNTLDAFLSTWCSRMPYLLAIVAGERRRNLDGTLSDAPNARAREVAQATIDARTQLAAASTPATALR